MAVPPVRILLVSLAVAAVPAVPAAAAVGHIDGTPLDVYADGLGALQARFDGPGGDQTGPGEFYGPDSNPGHAGFEVAVGGTVYDDGSLTAVSGPTPSSPSPGTHVLHSVYDAGALLEITEDVTYTDQAHSFAVAYAVKNVSATPQDFRALELADLYAGGDDHGVGLFVPGPPREVGGRGATDPSIVGALVEDPSSPWSHYEESDYGSVFSDGEGSGLTDHVDPSVTDNGAGVEWDATGVAPGDTRTYRVVWTFSPEVVSLSPTSDSGTAGTSHTVHVQVADASGSPVAYTISGPNATAGAQPLALTSGAADVTWTGAHPGLDTLTVWVDANGDGQPSAGEPQARSTMDWAPAPAPAGNAPTGTTTTATDFGAGPAPGGPPPPVFGHSVDVARVSGTVLIRVPGSHRLVPLGPGERIPLGALVDTTRGIVRLTAQHGAGGPEQSASFFAGQFVVGQRGGRNPVTELTLAGALPACGPAVARTLARTARRRRVRSLWGDGHGSFRTRGRYSAATVRGTRWLTQDECGGTLTRVARGVVAVDDLVRHRTVLVHAGHSYLARAPRPRGRRP